MANAQEIMQKPVTYTFVKHMAPSEFVSSVWCNDAGCGSTAQVDFREVQSMKKDMEYTKQSIKYSQK